MIRTNLLSREQLSKLNTIRLLAYKKRLHRVHETRHYDYGNHSSGYGDLFVTKEDPWWHEAMEDLKEELSTREHVARNSRPS